MTAEAPATYDDRPARLKAWRARMGWTQAQAALKLGYSTEAFGQFEAGRWKGNGQPIGERAWRNLELAALALTLGADGYDFGEAVTLRPQIAVTLAA
jgi:transcriptional regulator with XRE-family HTH domain